jgi:hypothetical protein
VKNKRGAQFKEKRVGEGLQQLNRPLMFSWLTVGNDELFL